VDQGKKLSASTDPKDLMHHWDIHQKFKSILTKVGPQKKNEEPPENFALKIKIVCYK
jgi:hypothetical protein